MSAFAVGLSGNIFSTLIFPYRKLSLHLKYKDFVGKQVQCTYLKINYNFSNTF